MWPQVYILMWNSGIREELASDSTGSWPSYKKVTCNQAMKIRLLCCFHSFSKERSLKSSLQVHTRHSGLLVQQLIWVLFNFSKLFSLLFCCWKIDLSSYISFYFSVMLQPITVQYLLGIFDFNYSDSIPDFTVKMIKIFLFSPKILKLQNTVSLKK